MIAGGLEVAILVGLQGSGKSSFFSARLAATHVHISKDLMPNSRRKNRRQLELLAEALESGRSAAIDNTNARRADRAPLIELAHRLGATVVGYWFDAPLEECLLRNRLRLGKARVPDVALYATAARLEPPAIAEGFDALFLVRLAPGGFSLSPG